MDRELIAAATATRAFAHAPYSRFAVGAALATRSGKIYSGCNVENVSLGLTICAERSAVASAIAQGSQDFAVIAVVTAAKTPAVPCGACCQVLAEFNPQTRVIAATINGQVQEFNLAQLLPSPSAGILEALRDV